MGRYDDIINLERPTSEKHRPMGLAERAAQFSSFAALTGYDEEVNETGRITERRYELDADKLEDLNEKMQKLKDNISDRPEITVTYFVPDSKKQGGEYIDFTGSARSVDECGREVIFSCGTKIAMDDIYNISGDMF